MQQYDLSRSPLPPEEVDSVGIYVVVGVDRVVLFKVSRHPNDDVPSKEPSAPQPRLIQSERNAAYDIYLQVTRSPLAARQRVLKTEILATKAELLRTSAQDQFAKWAKLRRSVDKGLADLEKLNAEVAASKSGFSMKFNTLLWLLTTGLQFVVGWWYRKQPVFFLPEGWFGPLTWWLSLPFAPAGSVSVGVWQMACKRVIVVGERVVKEFYAPGALQPEKVAVPSLAPTPNNTPRKDTKKEKEK
ncbi:hypothetical protein NLJ89_g2678 [Agrocybe chaxingu]|uniref:Guided entry of tail-anchored proteins 1 n=1 Tax=Agrocybe chaxingu TaxID=84603 RepID=A0A9W8K3W8_9AGAR|nr:hypothetical protein NLJ89_g2678 [Agrocybe chaxingu]